MSIAIYSPQDSLRLKHFSELLLLPRVSTITGEYRFYLTEINHQLCLLDEKGKHPFTVDFSNASLQHRLAHPQKELLKKALGITSRVQPRVLDVTAGWGQDAYVIAHFGCEVTLVERHPIVAELLAQGITQACDDNAAQRLHLVKEDAVRYLANLGAPVDVVYCDPMFEETGKSALVKKPMQILQALVGYSSDDNALAHAAINCQSKRVVIKRALHAPVLLDKAVTFTLKGKATRFDVYEI